MTLAGEGKFSASAGIRSVILRCPLSREHRVKPNYFQLRRGKKVTGKGAISHSLGLGCAAVRLSHCP